MTLSDLTSMNVMFPGLTGSTGSPTIIVAVGSVGFVELIVVVPVLVESVWSVNINMVMRISNCLKLTSHIKDEGGIDKWRSVASQGIASLTEIFSCI